MESIPGIFSQGCAGNGMAVIFERAVSMAIFDFINVKHLLLEMAQHQTVDVVLKLAVNTLDASSGVGLVRVWLIEPADGCPRCQYAPGCKDKTRCMHLMASAGQSIVDGTSWTYTTGSSFRRFPLGIRKVGEIAKEGKPIAVLRIDPDDSWVADADWVKRENIIGFVGQPLVCRKEILGVLAVFTREHLDEEALDMLRMVADHLAYAIANARAFEMVAHLKEQIELENAYLREEIKEAKSYKGIIGQSAGIEHIRELIRLVAPTDANVLIYGESGTGKEVIAREIHACSDRNEKPMITVNCCAIPRELFESEFFGHARGAFTGAVKSRTGYFQAADGGTLFLDEIGEIPVYLQSKLLRVIQEGEYQRLGEDTTHKVNVRIISATNRNLHEAIQLGHFREDLYYRLQVFPILALPLRERKDDIPILIEHFMRLCAKNLKRPLVRLTEAQLQILTGYDWPGNIRELQNIIERIVITAQAGPVLLELQRSQAVFVETAARNRDPEILKLLSEEEVRNVEKENMQESLRRANWKIYGPHGAAKLLGIKPTTLISRLKKMGIYKCP